MITGIVVALAEELSTLTSKKLVKGNYVFINENIVVAYSGAGPSNAQAAAKLLIAQGATQLISWGCAAALSSALKPGDLVLADSLIDSEGKLIELSTDWHSYTKNLFATTLKVQTGSLVERKKIVATGGDKQQLYRKTGAIALDMESIAIAKVASQNKLRFLAIRAIVDPVTMDLPKAIGHSLNSAGDIELIKLLAFIAGHPAELPGLIKLGLHFHAAKNTLKSVARQLAQLCASV